MGGGPLKDELLQLRERLQLTDCLEFLGIRRDVAKLMSAADVFVLSSALEGFGLVVAEAMACERPVVATDCGGVKEVVGDAGFTVPTGDFDVLASSINMVLGMSPADRLQLGINARGRIVQEYSLSKNVDFFLSIYL